MFDLSGKSALITGGTGGIGAAIANSLAVAGCRAFAAGLPAVATGCDLDDRVEALSLDVSDKESIDRLVAGLDRLDILVNSAGIIRREAEYELDTFEEVIGINLTGTLVKMASEPHTWTSSSASAQKSLSPGAGVQRAPAHQQPRRNQPSRCAPIALREQSLI
jgi:NAD(P)-dependent dehydrogenase (short-subunit alcohol dehydrogenase family)